MLLRGRGDGERWQPGLGVDGLQGRRHLARGRRAHPRRDPPQRVPRPGELRIRRAGTAEIKRTFPER